MVLLSYDLAQAGIWFRCVKNLSPGRMRVQGCIENEEKHCYNKEAKKNKDFWKRVKLQRGDYRKYSITGHEHAQPKLYVISSGLVFLPSLIYSPRRNVDWKKCKNTSFDFIFEKGKLKARGY